MNFQRLNEFLKKKKNWKVQEVTRGSIRLARTECVTDRWVSLTGQQSTVNFDQAKTGPWWAGPRLDMGRAETDTWLLLVKPRRQVDFNPGSVSVGSAFGGQRGMVPWTSGLV
jgi:hypothetical protein